MPIEILSKPAQSSESYSYYSYSDDDDATNERDGVRQTGLLKYGIDEPQLVVDDTAPVRESKGLAGDDDDSDVKTRSCLAPEGKSNSIAVYFQDYESDSDAADLETPSSELHCASLSILTNVAAVTEEHEATKDEQPKKKGKKYQSKIKTDAEKDNEQKGSASNVPETRARKPKKRKLAAENKDESKPKPSKTSLVQIMLFAHLG